MDSIQGSFFTLQSSYRKSKKRTVFCQGKTIRVVLCRDRKNSVEKSKAYRVVEEKKM